MSEDEDNRQYAVVINHEEQYSIWFADREPPAGWRTVGKVGRKDECLAFIEEVWTDMRPLSLRKQMEEWAKLPVASEPRTAAAEPRDEVDDLVRRLGAEQSVRVVLRPEATLERLAGALERGFVHVLFATTGTELGVRLVRDECDFGAGDLKSGKGSVRLVGTLVLNYNRVRFVGELDLASFEGRGRLEFLERVKPGDG